MKKLLILLSFISLLFAREDPFTPLITPKESIRPYYGESSVFESANIEFPSSARLIKKIEVTFQNIDGSIESKSIPVSGRIDWRMPLEITQKLNKMQNISKADSAHSNDSKSSKTKSSKAESTKDSIKTNKLDSASQASTKDSTIANKIGFKQESKIQNRNLKTEPYIIDNNNIFISYKGNLKRDFIMQNPFRIVLDLDINKDYYKCNKITINKPYFTLLKYGLHTDFMRIVLELDGSYVYKLEKKDNGILINVQ